MIGKTTRLVLAGAMIGVLAMSGTAHAKSVNGLIVDIANVGDSLVFDFTDRDVSAILTPGGVPVVGPVNPGDIIFGTLGIRQIQNVNGTVLPGMVGDTPLLNDELAGIYAMGITGVNPVPGGAITSAPLSQAQLLAAGLGWLQPYGFGNGIPGGVPGGSQAMVAMFTETTPPGGQANYTPNPAAGLLDVPGATDGLFWTSYGGPNGWWTITDTQQFGWVGAIFNTVTASNAPANLQIGTLSFSLPQVLGPLGSGGATTNLNFTTPLTPTFGKANALLGGGGGGGAPTSDLALSGTATVVPLPPAVFGGLGLFGLGLLIRRRFF